MIEFNGKKPGSILANKMELSGPNCVPPQTTGGRPHSRPRVRGKKKQKKGVA